MDQSSPSRKLTRAEKREIRRAQAHAVRQDMGLVGPRKTHGIKTREITRDDVEQILEAIACGDTATGASRDRGLTISQFLAALDRDTRAGGDARVRYDRARSYQAEVWADDIIDTAEAPLDIVQDGEGNIIPGASQAELTHRALRINTKKWMAGKYNIKFSDRQTVVHEGNPERPVAHADVTGMTKEELTAELHNRHNKRIRTI